MSTQDYNEIEKLFSGAWRVDRDVNLEEFMTAAEMPNNLKELFRDELQNHAIVILQRTGNSITESFLMEGESFTDTTIKLNEVLDYKATEEDPTYHVKVLPTFKDGVLTIDVVPQIVNGGRRRINKLIAQGNEIIMEMSVPERPGIKAKRFYKKC